MGRYSPDEVSQIRENINKAIQLTKSGFRWKPNWRLHDQLGVTHPDIPDKPAFDLMLKRRSNTPPNDGTRIARIWTPYLDAEMARAQTERDDFKGGSWDDELLFTVIGGTTATGKSTIRRQMQSSFSGDVPNNPSEVFKYIQGLDSVFQPGSVVVDPDDAKLILPEYQAHLYHQTPGGASFVHDESRNVAESLRERALKDKSPIIYDTSGQFNNGYETLSEMRRAGYRIPALYFFGDIDELIARAKERERLEGRGVPTGVIPIMQNNLTSIVPSLWTNGSLDELILIDSTNLDNQDVFLHLRRNADGTTEVVIEPSDSYGNYFRSEDWFR
jgi:hypothetical protein